MPQLVAPIELESLNELTCEVCGVAMRLYGIEPHPSISSADMWTYVCSRCEEVQTATVSHSLSLPPAAAFDAEATSLLGSTFDAAWDAVVASDSLPADAQHGARERLAGCIIEMFQQGEINPNCLAERALRRLKKDK